MFKFGMDRFSNILQKKPGRCLEFVMPVTYLLTHPVLCIVMEPVHTQTAVLLKHRIMLCN